MQFLIADTFTDSLTRLTADQQKAVKTTAFDLQTNPSHPSLQFHRLDKAKDGLKATISTEEKDGKEVLKDGNPTVAKVMTKKKGA